MFNMNTSTVKMIGRSTMMLQQSSSSLRHVVPYYSKIRNNWLKTVTSFKILTNYFARRYFYMVFIKYFICCTYIFIHVFLFVSYHVDLTLSFGNARLHQTWKLNSLNKIQCPVICQKQFKTKTRYIRCIKQNIDKSHSK